MIKAMTKEMIKEKKRVLFSFIIFSGLFLIVLSKAFYVQIINQKQLLEYSHKQTLRSREVYPNRTHIFDRNGSPLAINVQTYSLFMIPKSIKTNKRKRSLLRKLAKAVPELSYRKLLKKIKGRKRYTWLARKISLSETQVNKIKKLKGIYLESIPKRIYPNGNLASQILGFVGTDNKGLEGVEYLFDKELRGKPKILKYIKDAKGRAVKYESQSFDGHAKPLYLTIDKELQAVSEKYLKEAVLETEASMGGIGVMDSQTGEILAMANFPSFDPNKISSSKSHERKLSFVTDPFEPGSTFKLVTAASSLEESIAKPDTNYYCEKGKLQIQGHTIREADTHKTFEWLSLKDIIKYSSNIGTSKIAFDLGYERLSQTIENFGFFDKTQVELPGESRGIHPEDEDVSLLSLSNISFGQGIATTGIQMLSAYSAISNDGVYIKPTIIKSSAWTSSLDQEERRDERSKRILSRKVARQLQEMLVEAVEDGTGQNAKIPYFKIAGKTSTAQKVSPKGGYEGYVSGFIGFPLNVDKRFVIYVYIDNPKRNQHFGNIAAAPVFKKVAQYILYKNQNVDKISIHQKSIKQNQLDRVSRTLSSSVKRSYGKGKIPNFIGLDKLSAQKLAAKYKLKLITRGMGLVESQSLRIGQTYREGDQVILTLFLPTYN